QKTFGAGWRASTSAIWKAMAVVTRFRMPTDAHSHIHPPRWYSQNPRDGAKARANIVERSQYPSPSPLRPAGMKSVMYAEDAHNRPDWRQPRTRARPTITR